MIIRNLKAKLKEERLIAIAKHSRTESPFGEGYFAGCMNALTTIAMLVSEWEYPDERGDNIIEKERNEIMSKF